MSEFELHFSPIAERDLDEITTWYKRIRKGLDDEFIFCLEIELELIKRNPFIYGELRKGVRRAVMHRFPYNVYYSVGSFVMILGIVHHKRGTKAINKKLRRK